VVIRHQRPSFLFDRASRLFSLGTGG
jgi:hypothetical protein